MGLREEMPKVTAFVDGLREAFGRDTVNGWIMGRGGAQFWASEGGREWGTRPQLDQGASLNSAQYIALGKRL